MTVRPLALNSHGFLLGPRRVPWAKALIVVDALNCLIKSEVSGMSTLTELVEMTRPSTLKGVRPSKVRTMGNEVPGLSDHAV